MDFLQAALRDAMVVRQCQSELALAQPHQCERAVSFLQVVLRVLRMALPTFFPPRSE